MESLNLSGFFQTKSQARDFSLRLARISQRIFETSFQLEPALTDEFGLKQKEELITLMRDQAVNLEKPSAIKDFLTRLQTQVNGMPVLTLSLAFEPKGSTLKVLSDWFILNLKQQVLFDISVDQSLIAGLSIHYNGRYLDFSVRQTFHSVVSAMLSPVAQQPARVPPQSPHAVVPQAQQLPPPVASAQPAMPKQVIQPVPQTGHVMPTSPA